MGGRLIEEGPLIEAEELIADIVQSWETSELQFAVQAASSWLKERGWDQCENCKEVWKDGPNWDGPRGCPNCFPGRD